MKCQSFKIRLMNKKSDVNSLVYTKNFLGASHLIVTPGKAGRSSYCEPLWNLLRITGILPIIHHILCFYPFFLVGNQKGALRSA